jgi:membrane-associated phospholipid phosphatase
MSATVARAHSAASGSQPWPVGPDLASTIAVRIRLRAAVLVASAAAALAAAPARADEPRPSSSRVEWSPDWPRFRIWEYAGTAAFGLGAWYIDRYHAPPATPGWSGGILFDDAVRDWLRADTRPARERAGTISDVLWYAGSAYPFVVDLPVALFAHRQPRVMWQLGMMNLEAFAVAGFLNRFIMFGVGRARPSAASCANDPGYDALCGTVSNNASFPSGHTLGVATAAGLTCVHHRYLPLYGSVAADRAACVALVVATGATAVTRVISDRHWASDDVAGAAIGFGAGYGLPWLLHYRGGAARPAGAAEAWQRPLLLPMAGATTLGVALVGLL